MTPNEKLVWAAKFSSSGSPISAAYKVIQLRTCQLDGSFPRAPTDEEAQQMLEEMRRDA